MVEKIERPGHFDVDEEEEVLRTEEKRFRAKMLLLVETLAYRYSIFRYHRGLPRRAESNAKTLALVSVKFGIFL